MCPRVVSLVQLYFLVVIYDMPKFLTRDTQMTSSKVVGYADDATAYVKAKTIENLSGELKWLGSQMVTYCNQNGLKLNSQKTQIMTSSFLPRGTLLFCTVFLININIFDQNYLKLCFIGCNMPILGF